jgi:hypothetical protein
MRRALVCFVLLLIFVAPMLAQQRDEDITKFNIFTGYSHLRISPLDLGSNGFNTSVGVNVKRWMGIGSDFSVFSGSTVVPLDSTVLATNLSAAGVAIPLPVKANVKNYTFSFGPQIEIRHWRGFTPFIRPVFIGGMHASADIDASQVGPFLLANANALLTSGVKPTDLLAIQQFAAGLPAAKFSDSDTKVYYGVGGGLDVVLHRNVGMRVAVDFVHTKLFDNLLKGQNNLRISVGPTWRFGEFHSK